MLKRIGLENRETRVAVVWGAALQYGPWFLAAVSTAVASFIGDEKKRVLVMQQQAHVHLSPFDNALASIPTPAFFTILFVVFFGLALLAAYLLRRFSAFPHAPAARVPQPRRSTEKPQPTAQGSAAFQAAMKIAGVSAHDLAEAVQSAEDADRAVAQTALASATPSPNPNEQIYDFLSDVEHWFHARQIARPDARNDFAPDDPLRTFPGAQMAGRGYDRETLREYMERYHARAVAQYRKRSSARADQDDMVTIVLNGPQKVWDIFRICDYLYYLDNGRRMQKWTMS